MCKDNTPYEPPTFTAQELKDSIPVECFQRDTAKSLFYFFRDCVAIAVLYVLYYVLYPMNTVLYIVWAFTLGTYMWAFFVVGHDCGHGSFSDHVPLNYLIGHITHTFVLTPFHPWRISHRKHHMNTGHLEKDDPFVPQSNSNYRANHTLAKILRYDLFWLGGFLLYLMFGMPDNAHSHFNPKAPYYTQCKSEINLVKQSFVWYFSFIGVLLTMQFYYHLPVMTLYVIPYMVFNAWISIVTHLHHTDGNVPWYRGEEWNFVRGALSSVDRSYGIFDDIHHDIGTHIVHHLFIGIPHYNLRKATSYLKPKLGKFYRMNKDSIFKSLWKNRKECNFVNDTGNVVFYKSGGKHEKKD